MTKEDNIKQYTEASEWFLELMRNKLKKNSHKGNWRDENVQQLVAKMKAEVFELDDALEEYGSTKLLDENVTGNDVIDECVDIANFCLFIADTIKHNRASLKDYKLFTELWKKFNRGEFNKFLSDDRKVKILDPDSDFIDPEVLNDYD